MNVLKENWVPVATFGAGYEADVAVSVLQAAGVPAVRVLHDIVGIFGPGFEGQSSHGVTVLVPISSANVARELLSANNSKNLEGSLRSSARQDLCGGRRATGVPPRRPQEAWLKALSGGAVVGKSGLADLLRGSAG